jgi:hypothetical protein
MATINKERLDFLAGGDGMMGCGIGSGEAGAELARFPLGWWLISVLRCN